MADERDDETNATERAGEDDDALALKPFTRRGGRAQPPTTAPAARTLRPEGPRRVAEPTVPRRLERGERPDRSERPRPSEGMAKQLIVGREIELKGEITSCDRLVIEGRVEAALSDARIIEVSPTGMFKGSANVDEADISGVFEGELLARDKLTVRSQGRISGSVRYGRIVIESGGEVSGDMQSLSHEQTAGDQGSDSRGAEGGAVEPFSFNR
jgi:cytoskeletal protein CcmA (bactofilin family)